MLRDHYFKNEDNEVFFILAGIGVVEIQCKATQPLLSQHTVLVRHGRLDHQELLKSRNYIIYIDLKAF